MYILFKTSQFLVFSTVIHENSIAISFLSLTLGFGFTISESGLCRQCHDYEQLNWNCRIDGRLWMTVSPEKVYSIS